MLNSSRKPTIRDVAQMAHVSTATVSQIINGVDEFSDETVRRVWDVVNALHYRPNKLAKQLLASRHSEQPREKTGLILRAVFYPHDGDISIELEQKCGYAFERQCAKKGLYGRPFFNFPEKFSPPQNGEFFESQKEEHFHFSKNSP